MSQYLLLSTLINQIKDEMAGQAPSESKIVRAISAEERNLGTKYDIDSFIRTKSISVVTDGSIEYKLDTLIPTLDCRKVKTIKYPSSSNISVELQNVEFDDFMNDLDSGCRKNQFTTYYKDGFVYLRVSTYNFSDTVETMNLRYLTSNLAIDSLGNFYSEIQTGGNLYLLLQDTYLDLMCLGAQKRLFYPAIGDSDQTQVSLVRNRYESELKKLGLSSDAKNIERKNNKIKIRKQW